MKKDEIKKELALINKATSFDNPILRHYLKKYNLSDSEAVVLGILLDLTKQGKVEVRTHYNVLAEQSELSAMEVYQSVNALHRYRIIEYKPAGKFVHISFNKIDDNIDEITLAHINARKIKNLEHIIEYMRSMNYIPASELFDLVTPLVGKIIAQKIADAFRSFINYINDRLESATSMKMWKYKFISFKTGLPLAEVILRDSLPCIVDEILLIEKKTSVLIDHASRVEKSEADRDLVVAMLSAITDFIKTSFDKKSGLNEISFGDSRIILFESVYFYAAFVLKGSPDLEFNNNVESLLNRIHIKYRNPLKKFKGSMEGFNGISEILHEFLNNINTAPPADAMGEKSFKKLKIAAGLISFVILFFIISFIAGEIRDYRIEKNIISKINEELPLYSHDIVCEVEDDTVTVTGMITSSETGKMINNVVSTFPEIKKINNKAVIADFRTVEKFTEELAVFEKKFNNLQEILISQELQKIIIQFPSGITSIGENQALQARKIYELLKGYPNIDVDIIAFNDPVGGFELNKRLAHERMVVIKNYLISLGMDDNRISITDFNPDVISADPRYSEFKDSRGIMLFTKLKEI